MRNVYVAPLDRAVSAIGFGCASLGSRISAADGHRALEAAFNSGVTWYDVAPTYGDGYAEQLLGQFLVGRRDKIVVCTKVGIARPSDSLPKRVLRPITRSVVAHFPQARSFVSRARAQSVRTPIDPTAIELSVKASLRHLRTDYIDVLAIHEPTPQEAADGHIFDELGRLVKMGLVRTISIAGSPTSIAAALETARPIAFAQFADNLMTDTAHELRMHFASNAGPIFVTHGVFSPKALCSLQRLTQTRQAALEAVAQKCGLGPAPTPGDLLMSVALGNNPHGVVLASMFSIKHIRRNCALSAHEPSTMLVSDLRRMLQDVREPHGRSCNHHSNPQ